MMIGAGIIMILAALYGVLLAIGEQLGQRPRFLRLYPFMIALPFVANSSGWLLTEVGRSPWIVFGLMKIEDGVSLSVSAGLVLTSLIIFTLVYGVLMVADVYLMVKYARAGMAAIAHDELLDQPSVSLISE